MVLVPATIIGSRCLYGVMPNARIDYDLRSILQADRECVHSYCTNIAGIAKIMTQYEDTRLCSEQEPGH